MEANVGFVADGGFTLGVCLRVRRWCNHHSEAVRKVSPPMNRPARKKSGHAAQ
jgi:hypothetical protein